MHLTTRSENSPDSKRLDSFVSDECSGWVSHVQDMVLPLCPLAEPLGEIVAWFGSHDDGVEKDNKMRIRIQYLGVEASVSRSSAGSQIIASRNSRRKCTSNKTAKSNVWRSSCFVSLWSTREGWERESPELPALYLARENFWTSEEHFRLQNTSRYNGEKFGTSSHVPG